MNYSALFSLLLGFIAVLGFIGVFLFLIIRRGLQMKQLAHHGIPITGKILKIVRLGSVNHSRQSRNWRLRYTFTLADGRTYENGITPNEEERHLPVGGPIDLIYLPEKPEISATARMVKHAKGALKLP